MDTLALLCNLYGDGPQTLRRLREAGCGTLASLETLECERLASLLRTSVRAAKRFQAEGRLLRERSELSGERAPARRAGGGPAAAQAPPANPLVASVLSAWRERDAAGDGGRAAGAVTLAVEPRAHFAAARPAGSGIDTLDGMDAALLERLRVAGVDTFEALCEADVLDLAGRGVAGYTRLLHLQFLARRTPAPRPRIADSLAVPLPNASPVATPIDAPVVGVEVLGFDDLLVPARPPERRGGVRPEAVHVEPAVLRFSPSSELQEPRHFPLQAELDRRAAGRAPGDVLDRERGAKDDAGSSGPFA